MINLQQLIALFPTVTLIFAIIIVILSICYSRNHTFVCTLTILGLVCSCLSLFFLKNIIPINVTALFYIDKSSIIYVFMILFSAISACIFSYSWLEKYQFNKEELYVLFLLSTLGAVNLIFSNHMSSLFISIELLTLPVFGLIAYSNMQKYSLEAALKYIILSGVSSSFLLLGIAWIYAISGNLSFLSLDYIFDITREQEKLVILFGTIMILSSLFFKLSIVPFHLWTPDIYQGSSAAVLSFFSTVSKTAIFFILLRLFLHISNFDNGVLYYIVSLMIFLSVIFGNILALLQNDMKRFFGYSSISQLGYLLILLLAFHDSYIFSLEASIVYVCSYLFSNIAYFGIINLISNISQNKQHHPKFWYEGLFWHQPMLAIILTVIFLSLSGIPITLGFIGKFYILSIIINEHLWIVGIPFFVGSIIGLCCYLRMIINLYLTSPTYFSRTLIIPRYWFFSPSGIVVCISGINLLILGIYPNLLINLLQ